MIAIVYIQMELGVNVKGKQCLLFFITKKDRLTVFYFKMVGMTGFEPATTWSQTMCSTKLSHIPIVVRPVGIEPATFWSVAKRSIQLSYERKQH